MQSKWYTYDVHSQKLILTLLDSSINSNELHIGPFKPLSVFTATEVLSRFDRKWFLVNRGFISDCQKYLFVLHHHDGGVVMQTSCNAMFQCKMNITYLLLSNEAREK